MLFEECIKIELEDENKQISQLLKEILDDLKNLRQKIVENGKLRR